MKLQYKTPTATFDKIISIYGSQRKFAKVIGVSQQRVNWWFKQQNIPSDNAQHIFIKTKGKIKKEEIQIYFKN